MKKRAIMIYSVVCVVILTAVLLIGCPPARDGGDVVVAMVTDVGGLGDQSFNDGVFAGLQKAERDDGVEILIVESNQQTDYIPNISGFADDGADLVFAVGFLMTEAVTLVSQDYPDAKFAGVDISIDESIAPDNLQGITFKEEEAGYLAGVLAGLLTSQYADISPKLNDDNVVGIVLGLLIPPVERFEVGFKAGVYKYNPQAEVITIITETFNDTAKGKEAALTMIDQGADIVFPVAGLTGSGTIAAAQERGVFAIGVDVDQNYLAPDTVLTSAVKELEQASYLTIRSVIDDTFVGGNKSLGINDGAIGLAPFHDFDEIIPQEVKDILEQEKEAMRAGELNIPDTRDELDALIN